MPCSARTQSFTITWRPAIKVVTVLGTRPEIIRLSRTIVLLDESFEHVLVHTGQNSSFELNAVFFQELQIRKPDEFLNASTSSVASFLADSLVGIEKVLASEKPDAFLILGDTNSALTAVIAKKLHIPIFHLEAGNRSFDANVPEEANRRLIDHLADVNFPYSEAARRNLLAEGLEPRRTILSGSPLREILTHYAEPIRNSGALDKAGVQPRKYFVVSAHRQENVDPPERLTQLIETLHRIRAHYQVPMLISTHPRTRDKIERSGFRSDDDSIVFHEPFGFFDYVRLQQDAFCVLSDSGTLSEEAAIVGFPAVTMRAAIERPEAVETGVLVLGDVDFDRNVAGIDWIRRNWKGMEVPPEYHVANFSHRVVSAILSMAPSHQFMSGIR